MCQELNGRKSRISKSMLLVLLILIPVISFPQLKILKKMSLNVTLDLKGPPRGFYIDPPVYIYETYSQNQLIVTSDVFFEIFDTDGKAIAKVGDKGNGPGDFIHIKDVKKHNNLYYFHDFPNKINIFDLDFNFKKRIILQGPRCTLYVDSFALHKNKILAGQRKLYEPPVEKCITVYDSNWKYQEAFFDKEIGWEIYPKEALLSKLILTKNNEIYFAFLSIPTIWKLDQKGTVVGKKSFGENWWKKIHFNEGEFKKKKAKMGAWKALKEVVLSGDRIHMLWNWKDNIIVQIIREPYDNPTNMFLIISEDFKRVSKLVSYPDFQFCGVGNYIYFSKLIKTDRENNKKIVEVVQCDYEF